MVVAQATLYKAHASQIVSQPTGGITATNIQDAIEELEVEKQTLNALLTAIGALTPTDGAIIVGNGSTFVAESGNTARTSLGLGTSDSPQFDGLNVGHASDTTITRVSAGVIAVEGSTVALLPTLASTSNGEGASLISIEDPGANFSATDVEGALAELAGSAGGVDTSGTPVSNDYARFTDADTIEGRSVSEVQSDLDIITATILASTANGDGASNINIEDPGGLISATNVEGALAENRTAIDAIEADYLTSSDIGSTVLAQQTIGIADNNLLEVDGSPNSGEVAMFTANGLAGETEAEFKSSFNLEIGTDVQAYNANLTRAQLAMTEQPVSTSGALLLLIWIAAGM